MRRKHLVAAVAYDRLCTFEFGCAVELFALQRPEPREPDAEELALEAQHGAARAPAPATSTVREEPREAGAGTG